MLTGINLKELIEQYDIVPVSCFDRFSVTLHLSRTIRKYIFPDGYVVTYGESVKESFVINDSIDNEYILKPGQSILACSDENVKMPKGYIGMIQTKGSLARLFITVHCCDSQVESGFTGHVTFEICNMGTLNVRLFPNSPVAQMFVFKTSSDSDEYNGKYNNSELPTYSK